MFVRGCCVKDLGFTLGLYFLLRVFDGGVRDLVE